MADQKISQLTDGTSFQAGDEAVVNRSGTNYKVDPTKFGSSIDVTGTVTADGLNVGDGHTIGDDAFDNLVIASSSAESIILNSNTFPTVVKSDSGFRVETVFGSDRFKIDSSTGDISFYEDTGTTPKFFWDASAESLGIGTTDPKFTLQTVNGGVDSRGTGAGIAIRNNIYFDSGQDKYLTASGAAGTQYFDGNGNIIFYNTGTASTGAGNTASLSERMRIDSSGNLLVGTTTSPSDTGTVVADGIYLGGTGAANLLDDYETGTWTPVLTGATSGTYTFAGTNTYTKVGNQVTVWAEAVANNAIANFGTLAGNASISGLPFMAAADSIASIYYYDYTGTGTPYGFIVNTATSISIRLFEATTSNNSADAGDLDGTNQIRVCITYQV